MEKRKTNNFKDKYRNILKPLSSKKLTIYDFVGFDVETYGETNEFYMGGLYYYTSGEKEIFKAFYSRDEMINFILSHKFKNKYIVATNLGFDLTALFYGHKEWNNLNILQSGGNLIYADYTFKNSDKKGKIKFIDTMNYVPFSVEKLGSILKIPKLTKPSFIGEKPKNKEEEKELLIYNKRDCEISCLFMYLMQTGFNKSGGNLKITIASTSFDIWRRNFLPEMLVKEEMCLKLKDVKKFIFKGYYGGRTEVYKKGEFENLYYYDINSLYPSVMIKEYPLPQSVKEVPKVSLTYIKHYFGVSECLITCPDNLNKPFLPYRDTKKVKLLFPSGTFRGVWNNHELKKALELGYEIKKIYKQIIYTKTFYPFKEFVEYFYKLRQDYKKVNSPLELSTKLILNSLYGKFAQKEIKEFKIIDMNTYDGDYKEINKLMTDENYIIKDNNLIITETKEYNGKNVYPILSSYVTSYSRIKMFDYIKDDDVVYTDTDSVFIQSPKYENSKKLGAMKLEDTIKYGYFVKPKFYFTINNDNYENTKIKGISRATKEDFFNLIDGLSVEKMKFTKLKESVRRKIKPNTKIMLKKVMALDDNKREWVKAKSLQGKDILISNPIKLNETE